MAWEQKEWRVSHRNDIVKDPDGNIGIVTSIGGTILERTVCVSDVKGTEIYTNERSEMFDVVSLEQQKTFNIQRLEFLGYKIGTICLYQGDTSFPLLFIHIEWDSFHNKPVMCFKDLRKYNDNLLKTSDTSKVIPFDIGIPPLETIFSTSESGLPWRLQINLVETNRTGWANSGSVWEFYKKEDALAEVESWKAKLQIRRVASIINGDWKQTFPCWTIELTDIDNESFYRVKLVEGATGAPAYFQSAAHAAQAICILQIVVWKKTLYTSYDSMI